MRLKWSIKQEYFSQAEFWDKSCSYEGTGCCRLETIDYQKKCDEIWADWHKAGGRGKLPVMPPETVECQKCQYSDLSLGRFQGHASAKVICRHHNGTIPVSVEGRKKVWIDNCSQEQLDGLIERFDKDLEAFAITGSPKIKDFTFLEKFPKLKKVYIWWNHKAEHLWDFKKTPKIELLYLNSLMKLHDIEPLKDAKNLRYFNICGGDKIDSLKPLDGHASLEYVCIDRTIADENLNPIISIPTLKYFECQFNMFDIETYAKFEAKRPDVDTNFFEGIEGYDYVDDTEYKNYWIYSVGKRQRSFKYDDEKLEEKINKQKMKFLSIKDRYLND